MCDRIAYALLGLDIVNASLFDSGICGAQKQPYWSRPPPKSHCTTHRVNIIACKVYELQEISKIKGVVVDPEVVLGVLGTTLGIKITISGFFLTTHATVSLKVYHQLISISVRKRKEAEEIKEK